MSTPSSSVPPLSSPPSSFAPLPLKLDADGLVPVIVQDELTGEIRMFAYANAEAIQRTLESGRATFWSRSREEIWEKGLTSGNTVHVSRVLVDCDADCLIYASTPHGPSCHTGAPSCFFQVLEKGHGGGQGAPIALAKAADPSQTLVERLESLLEARKASTGKASYTKSLYEAGAPKIGAKVEEEAGEFAQAIAGETDERVVNEAADVLYHVLVGLRWRGIPTRQVFAQLADRFGTSGHEEKASRGPAAPAQ
jgi:phosphoribosyl-ATP pyrophosphohydrolase/phosphoribosyl-AMP cyclohydrolase